MTYQPEKMGIPMGADAVHVPWKCSRCGGWFQSGTMQFSCTVDHGGACCHHFDWPVDFSGIVGLDDVPQPSLFRRILRRAKQIINYPESLAGYHVRDTPSSGSQT